MANDLHETLGLASGHCLAEVSDGERPYRDGNSLFLRLLLGHAYAGNFGEGVHATGNRRVVGCVVSHDVFDSHHSLRGRGVGEQASTIGVTYAINALGRSAHAIVHPHKSPVGRNIDVFEPYALSRRPASNGNEHAVGVYAHFAR